MPGFTLPTSYPPTAGLGGYGIQQAHAIVNDVAEFVTERITDATRDAENMRIKAETAVQQLAAIDFDVVLPEVPEIALSALPEIPPVSLAELEDIQFDAPAEPSLLFPDNSAVPAEIDPFSTAYTQFNIPSPPSLPSTDGVPNAPAAFDVQMPSAPSLQFPAAPNLTAITIPTFNDSLLTELDVTDPTLADSPIAAVFNWSEPQYLPEILGEVEDKLRDMWNGRLGVPAEIENAMWLRATEREELTANRAVETAFSEFSNRGFTMPPGALARRTDRIREDFNRQAAGLNREITIEVAKIHVENVRTAVTQGVAVETLYYSFHSNMLNRMFEAEKARTEQQVTVYNALVNSFNAKVQLFQAKAQVHATRINNLVDVYKARLQGEQVRAEINTQNVNVYEAQLKALGTYVDIYQAQVQAAATQVDIGRSRVEQYRAEVQAYAEKLNAARIPFELYKVLVDAEGAKASFVDAEVKAYSAMISGKVANSEVAYKYDAMQQATNDTRIKLYAAQIDAEKASMQAQLGQVSAQADMYKADVSRYEAMSSLGIKVQTVEVSKYEAMIKLYEAKMRMITERTNQVLEAIKAAGAITSTMASGAMAGISVGASLSGAGQASGSGSTSFTEGLSFSQGIQESLSTTISENTNTA